jgi:hypothetical protein
MNECVLYTGAALDASLSSTWMFILADGDFPEKVFDPLGNLVLSRIIDPYLGSIILCKARQLVFGPH